MAAHEDEASKIRFMLNLDGAGQGKGGSESLGISGRPELVPYFEDFAKSTKYAMPISDQLHSHSDHYPYAIRGIPSATLNSPDDSSKGVGRGWGHTEADTLDKATLRGLQMGAMVTARLLLHVASDEAFPGTRRSKEELEQQLEELGLDIALKRSGRWSLVGGTADS
jgi:Zn-dependent M28 family amino/carboxypeptidase